MDHLATIINTAYQNKTRKDAITDDVTNAVTETLERLDHGQLRVATKQGTDWIVHQWIKKAILLSFMLFDNQRITYGRIGEHPAASWFDKVPLKTQSWTQEQWQQSGFRAVPGAIIRHSAYVAANTVLMPCFINVGAYVDEGTMVDTWSTIGSCAQIGKKCHISGGVGIGGVLEPLQAEPVIIEDHCFIGARCEVVEGVIVQEGSVLAMGVYLGASTKIIDRKSGAILYGRVPPYSVVVPGTIPPQDAGQPALAAAVIVKQVDERTRRKTSINQLLRE